MNANSLFSRHRLAAAISTATLIAPALAVTPAFAQSSPAQTLAASHSYNIAAQPLSEAMIEFGKQSGVQVSADSAMLANKQTAGVQGSMTARQAIDILLVDTELTYRMNGGMLTVVVKGATLMFDPVRVEGEAEGRFGDAPVEPGGFVAEYQTTATKMAMSIKETPQAISVVTRESMDARQVQNIHSAIELTSGVGAGAVWASPGPFAGRGQFGQAFSLRGQGLNYYRDIRSDGFMLGSLSTPDLAAYERIEVVKGPSGFYGQGSLGGYINLVRKKPKSEFKASISAQVGSYDTYRTEADITGALTEDKQLRGRLIFAYEDAGAFIDGVETATTLFAPSLEANIGENTRVLAQLLYQKEEFISNNGIPLKLEGDQLKPYDLSRSFFFGEAGDKSDTEALGATLKIDHELSDYWLATLLLQGNKDKRNAIQGNAGYDYYASPDVGVYATRDTSKTDSWAGELRLDGKFNAFDREHQLIFGIEINERNLERNYAAIYLGSANIYTDNFADLGVLSKNEIPLGRIINNTNVENKAVYVQTALNLFEHTKLLMSARYDWAKVHESNVVPNDKKSNQELTMRIGVTQELTNNISAYATYAESFNPVTQSGRNGILDPETGEGYELGLKTDWFDNRISATLAIYRQELDNRPISDPSNLMGEFYSLSAGLHRADGTEIEITGSPFSGLTVGVAATWMNDEFIDRQDDNYGLSIDGSVDHQFSLYANYELQQGALKGLGFGATLISLGERQFIESSRSDDLGNFLPNRQIYAEGYERVDLNLFYNGLPNWDMYLQVRNLFNKTYVEGASNRSDYGNHFGSPRGALFKVVYNFK